MKSDTPQLTIRAAKTSDASMILHFIEELADYEQLREQVTADVSTLSFWLFDKKTAEAIILEATGEPIGFALFFYNFSTFLGKAGIYLEDLYLLPEHRNMGYGSQVLAYLAKLALSRNCGRLEFSCLDWNKSALACYHKAKAEALNGWTTYRICGDDLLRLAAE